MQRLPVESVEDWSWAGLTRTKVEVDQSVIKGMMEEGGGEANWLNCHRQIFSFQGWGGKAGSGVLCIPTHFFFFWCVTLPLSASFP